MAFKGKSTIELRNAETGELEQRVEDENMITNAAYNLANPPQTDKVLNRTTRIDMPHCINPLLNNCFSSLLLFEQSITEDPNNIIVSSSKVKSVGYAVDSYTGTDKLRGTLNTAETQELENGKRYVWDFSTDKGNGTIRSVALSNPSAGLFGINSDPYDDGISENSYYQRCINYRSATDLFSINNQNSCYWAGGTTLVEASDSGFKPMGSFEVSFYL